MNAPTPTEIALHTQSKMLELCYGEQRYWLSAEFLRVHSPSAEVQGHSPSQAVLQTHKERVGITQLEPVGHYAIKIHFDDGHNSGLYSWDYLYRLATQHNTLWQDYLARLQAAGVVREEHPA